jgi:hypothetical protein
VEINPNKVIDAINALKAAADAMLADKVHVLTAAQCIEAAAALQASVQIAGIHRVYHITGTLN